MFMAYVGIVGFTDKPWTPCRQGTVRAECSVRLRDRRQYTAVVSAVGLQKVCATNKQFALVVRPLWRSARQKRKAAATFVAAAFCSISAYAPFATLRRKQSKTFFAPLHKSRDGSLCGTVFRHIPLRPFVMQKVYPQGFVCGVESPQGAYYIQVQKSVFRQEHACTSIPVCYHTNFQHNERREIQNAIVMGFPLCCA